jgi:hypothetical protein
LCVYPLDAVCAMVLNVGMSTHTCRHCNGTGYRPEVAHCDGGRCWHCNKVDTSYTRNPIQAQPIWVTRAASIMVGGGRKARRAVREVAA